MAWNREPLHTRNSWTDDLPSCPHAGLGVSANQRYHRDGSRSDVHEMEDTSFHHRVGENSLYGVLDGHDGRKVAEYARQRFPAELLLGQLDDGASNDEQIVQMLRNSFMQVDRNYFRSIDSLVAERTQLQLSLPQGLTTFQLYQQHQATMERIEEIFADISGGTTAVIALIHQSKLCVANVGDSRALLCTTDDAGVLQVQMLTVDHNTRNPNELERLAGLGLDVERLCNGRPVGNLEHTRSIGDFAFKGGYKDLDLLSSAISEPVIAVPHVHSPIPITHQTSFLVLMSDGLYQTLEEATDALDVNYEIAKMVNEKLHSNTTVASAAQAVVDKIGRLHQETEKFTYRGDMTLLIRNFNHPMKLRRTSSSSSTSSRRSYRPGTSPDGYSSPLHISLQKRSSSKESRDCLVKGVDSPPVHHHHPHLQQTPSTASTINPNDPFSPCLLSPAREHLISFANTPPPVLPTPVYRPASTSPIFRDERLPTTPWQRTRPSPPPSHRLISMSSSALESMATPPSLLSSSNAFAAAASARPVQRAESPQQRWFRTHRRVLSDPTVVPPSSASPPPTPRSQHSECNSPLAASPSLQRHSSAFRSVAPPPPPPPSQQDLPRRTSDSALQQNSRPLLRRHRRSADAISRCKTPPSVYVVRPPSTPSSSGPASPCHSPSTTLRKESKGIGTSSKDSGIDGSDPEIRGQAEQDHDDERTLHLEEENTVKTKEDKNLAEPISTNGIQGYLDFSTIHLPDQLLNFFDEKAKAKKSPLSFLLPC